MSSVQTCTAGRVLWHRYLFAFESQKLSPYMSIHLICSKPQIFYCVILFDTHAHFSLTPARI